MTAQESQHPLDMVPQLRECPACGYELRGLAGAKVCPECGQPIRGARAKTSAMLDNMVSANAGYLSLLMAGAFACAISGLALAAIYEFGPMLGIVHPLVPMAIACVWVGSVWVVTWPRPKRDGIPDRNDRPWMALRYTARFSQLLWIAGYAVGAATNAFGPTGSLLDVMLAFEKYLLVAATMSLAAPAAYGAWLAEWAGESGLETRFLAAAWCAVAFPLYDHLVVPLALLAPTSFGAVFLLLIPFVSLLSLIALIVFLAGWAQIASSASWAIRNAATARARDRRVAERKKERYAEVIAKQEAVEAQRDEEFEVRFAKMDEDPQDHTTQGLDSESVRRGNYMARRDDIETYDLAEPDEGEEDGKHFS
ncbi:MAG: zinc ribbon domain-containing protein [Planctomycetota bacterium]